MADATSFLRWVIIAPEVEVIKWTAAFQKEAPEIILEVGPGVLIQQALIYFYCGSTHKAASPPLNKVKLYYSLGAGVDHLMKDKDYFQVYLLSHSRSLTAFSMSNYILFAVLYYQRKWDKFLKDRKIKYGITMVYLKKI